MIGLRFGRLTVKSETDRKLDPNGRTRRAFRCRCKCGTEIIALGEDLRSGNTRSCGCLQVESVIKKNWKHGQTPRNKINKKKWPPLYQLWANMKDRCNNPHHKSYKDYGDAVSKYVSDGQMARLDSAVMNVSLPTSARDHQGSIP